MTARRWGRRVATAAAAGALAAASVVPLLPAGAAVPRASVNGDAVAAGALVPLAVNPNFDLWPAYSLSHIEGAGSHGISGGFYPGFLLDAFAFQYGRQTEARSMMGLAETQWPDDPHRAEAATSDFGSKCRFGREFGIPAYMTDSCKSFWDQFVAGTSPMEGSAGRSASDQLASAGAAHAVTLTLGDGVTVGTVSSTSGTNAREGRTTADATVVLEDVSIGELHIGSMRSTATAASAGTIPTTDARGGVTFADVTYAGRRAVITDRGVLVETGGGQGLEQDISGLAHPDQLRDVSDQLAAQGFDVRLLPVLERVGTTDATAESGGLVVRLTREPPPDLGTRARDVCAATAAQYPEPITTVPLNFGDNPLYDDEFPFNQTDPALEYEIAIPPPAPCIAILFDHAVDVGFVLGPARASARFDPLPPEPVYRPPAFGGAGFFVPYESIGQDGSGVLPSFPDLGVPPSFTEPGDLGAQPPPSSPGTPVVALGAEVSRRVETLYGAILGLVGLLVVGRSTFRRLMRL